MTPQKKPKTEKTGKTVKISKTARSVEIVRPAPRKSRRQRAHTPTAEIRAPSSVGNQRAVAQPAQRRRDAARAAGDKRLDSMELRDFWARHAELAGGLCVAVIYMRGVQAGQGVFTSWSKAADWVECLNLDDDTDAVMYVPFVADSPFYAQVPQQRLH